MVGVIMLKGVKIMQRSEKISHAVIRRLPRYYRYLGELLDSGITKISSKELSRRMNVTASQIRQDFNHFGCFGQQGYGYNVENLYEEVKKILGLAKNYNIIIIGAGNIGQALVNYGNFKKRGFNITAMFDINPEIIGQKIEGVKVYDANKLVGFLAENEVDIGVIAIDGGKALETADILVAGGVSGIWNFSPTEVPSTDKVAVENVHLTDSIMVLSYKINGL